MDLEKVDLISKALEIESPDAVDFLWWTDEQLYDYAFSGKAASLSNSIQADLVNEMIRRHNGDD